MSSPAEQRQVAALPFRLDETGACEVLLVTSRETRRWVIPKGWPMPSKSDPEAACQEAFEEAGVQGRIGCQAIGTFSYFKRRGSHGFDLIDVAVFPLQVTALLKDWPERKERKRRWMPPEKAARLVAEAGLTAMLRRPGLCSPIPDTEPQ